MKVTIFIKSPRCVPNVCDKRPIFANLQLYNVNTAVAVMSIITPHTAGK